MARLIRSDRDGPFRIEPQDKPIFICGCGLTGNWPFCDGTHKTCVAQEQQGKLYLYDENRQIKEEWDDS